MKKFLLEVILFFALVAVMDVICGWGFDYLKSKARGGQTFKNEYLFNTCKDDILILGSSRANHHYLPCVITDSIGLTCYNAGEQGCGIIPAYVRYRVVCEKKKPKLVLYEVTPRYDYFMDKNGYSNYLGAIRQYADKNDIKKMYLDFSDNLEPLRLFSGMYRNNSSLIKNVKDILKPSPNNNGYDPLYGVIHSKTKQKGKEIKTVQEIDSLKLSYFERLVVETKADGVKLIFIVSPSYKYHGGIADYEPAIELSRRYDIPMLNYDSCEQFIGKDEYFQDNTHLNNSGALAYTKYIIPQIKTLLNSK